MQNSSDLGYMLQVEGLELGSQLVLPVFVILFGAYVITVVTNLGLMAVIFVEKNLQHPMYLLFCNLSINDVVGSTTVLPKLMADIISTESVIGYVECVSQAFSSHTYATASHTILMIMAFDRYVAIYKPLRYPSIMTTSMVVKLSLCAWGSALFLVSILLGLTIRLTRCRSLIVGAHCDNAALFKLSCQDVSINNIYGLAFTAVLFSSSFLSIALTYITIVKICVTKKNKELNSKALQTCASHLVVYLIMLTCGFTVVLLHRLPVPSSYRKLASVLLHSVPGCANPIVYALNTKELRKKLKRLFRSKIVDSVTKT